VAPSWTGIWKSAMGQREHAQQLIARLPEAQLSSVVGRLETIIDPVAASMRNASLEHEEISAEEAQAVAEANEWLQRNQRIPHEEILAEFGLKP
jgi:hypothetical protein